MTGLLSIQEVTKIFSGHQALDCVTFDIPESSIFGLLGPNGAGKTTLIRIINQITAADSGNILYRGEPLNRNHISNIGYLPEERGLYKKMKVIDQIVYFAQLKDVPKTESRDRAEAWLKRFELYDWRHKKVEELSKGMQQKVQFITTVIHNPGLIILDEPFSGFDPINAELLKTEIKRLRDQGATIIFSTHRMESVEEICDNIAMINRSKLVLQGPVKEIKERFKEDKVLFEFSGEYHASLPEAVDMQRNPDGSTRAIFDLKTHNLADLVTKLSGSVHLHSMKEMVPTMNEIFIRTVKHYQA